MLLNSPQYYAMNARTLLAGVLATAGITAWIAFDDNSLLRLLLALALLWGALKLAGLTGRSVSTVDPSVYGSAIVIWICITLVFALNASSESLDSPLFWVLAISALAALRHLILLVRAVKTK